jgi:glycerol-3-phosphate dehydrogenase
VKNEMALTVEDVLARRTRLLFLDAHAAIDAAPVVARVMASAMQKDERWINEQIASFTELAKQYCIDAI